MLLWNGEETGFIQSAKQTLFNYTVKHLLKANNVQDAIDELSENLTEQTTNKKFIFDCKDGQYGWNESEERGADTFHPFKSKLSAEVYGLIGSNHTVVEAKPLILDSSHGYSKLTLEITHLWDDEEFRVTIDGTVNIVPATGSTPTTSTFDIKNKSLTIGYQGIKALSSSYVTFKYTLE